MEPEAIGGAASRSKVAGVDLGVSTTRSLPTHFHTSRLKRKPVRQMCKGSPAVWESAPVESSRCAIAPVSPLQRLTTLPGEEAFLVSCHPRTMKPKLTCQHRPNEQTKPDAYRYHFEDANIAVSRVSVRGLVRDRLRPRREPGRVPRGGSDAGERRALAWEPRRHGVGAHR